MSNTTPADKWVEALRSGEYKQAFRSLANDDKTAFCCLGVACELAKAEGIINDYNPFQASMPQIVQDWMGLQTPFGKFRDENGYTEELSIVNDNGGTFTEIADIIASDPEGLFNER